MCKEVSLISVITSDIQALTLSDIYSAQNQNIVKNTTKFDRLFRYGVRSSRTQLLCFNHEDLKSTGLDDISQAKVQSRMYTNAISRVVEFNMNFNRKETNVQELLFFKCIYKSIVKYLFVSFDQAFA